MRERLYDLERSGDEDHWTSLLNETEQVIGSPEGRLWLDLQRYSLMALSALGHSDSVRACTAILTLCLQDHQDWPRALLKDGTPCASEATREWIQSEKIGITADVNQKLELLHGVDGSRATSEASQGELTDYGPKELDPWDQAKALVRDGQATEALAVIAQAARGARSGRERFIRTLQQAELCLVLERGRQALPLLNGLAERVDEFKLDQWEETSLCARVFANLYSCLRGQDAARASAIYDRLCQLDLGQALSLGGD
jgi:hypothetical protein